MRLTPVEVRNQVLTHASNLLMENQRLILKANEKDLNALPKNTPEAFRDRLMINPQRIQHMSESLKQVAQLKDPLGEGESVGPLGGFRTLPNGLKLKKIRSPLGVLFMIFESRPNVAVEAFSMGFKSGNAMILRGGKESHHTTHQLYKLLEKSLLATKLPREVLWGIVDSDRKMVQDLLQQKDFIDVVVPRGGAGLINYVVKNSLIPIIKNDRGLCHVYVHSDAFPEMAIEIITNAKTQRPSVCNSMETLLIHQDIASHLLPRIYKKMESHQVHWWGCPQTLKILKGFPFVKKAQEKNWNTEYLDQIINCKVVKNIEEAIDHIETYGSHHSEAIVTENADMAKKFQNEVDAAVVYWNASTRFTDGFEFGLGGELGISTQKLHVRGPVGLQALTSERWIVDGVGQIRK